MTHYEFRALSETQKHTITWDCGVMIGERVEAGLKVILYQVCDFYVEIFYGPKQNDLEILRSFVSINCLEPYLNQISLSELKIN